MFTSDLNSTTNPTDTSTAVTDTSIAVLYHISAKANSNAVLILCTGTILIILISRLSFFSVLEANSKTATLNCDLQSSTLILLCHCF